MGADSDRIFYSLPDDPNRELMQSQYDPDHWRDARGHILTDVTPPDVLQAIQEASGKSIHGFTLDTHLTDCGNYGLVQVVYVLDAGRVPSLNHPIKTDIRFDPKTGIITTEAPREDPNKTINPLAVFFLRYYIALNAVQLIHLDRSYTTPIGAIAPQNSPYPTTFLFFSPHIHTDASAHIVRTLGGKPSTAPFNSKFAALIIAPPVL